MGRSKFSKVMFKKSFKQKEVSFYFLSIPCTPMHTHTQSCGENKNYIILLFLIPLQIFPTSFSAVIAAKAFWHFCIAVTPARRGEKRTNPAFPFHRSRVSFCFRRAQLLLVWQDKSACFTFLLEEKPPWSEQWCLLPKLGWLLGMFFFEVGYGW